MAGMIALLVAQFAHAQLGTVLFSENFDSLAGSLGPSVNERTGVSRVTRVATDPASTPVPNAFSHVGPAGWTIDNNFDGYGASVGNTGVPQLGNPEYGVDEWEGWSFARKEFWIFADDQTRSSFTKASGNVAVADADEWDDLNINPATRQGFMNTNLASGNINVTAYRDQLLTLTFDSSWRPEAFDDSHGNPAFNSLNNQSAVVAVSYDGGTEDFIGASWNSNPASPFFKGDQQNETIARSFLVPDSATNLQIKFGYYNAANDWWWAIDNLSLTDAAMNVAWSENFDSVPLGPSVNERALSGGHVTVVETTPNTNPVPNAFTHTTPAGWNVDNSQGLPGVGDPAQGVQEWEGWSFTQRDFWLFVKDSNRSQFSNSSGVFAVADPDNWDALGDPEALGTFNSLLETPTINIAGVPAGQLLLAFDSSWRDEDTQTAVVEVDFGSGYQTALRWESVAGPNFHDDNENESVLLMLNNPAGATTAKVRFGLINSTDDWWWAVDNIRIGLAIPEPSTVMMAVLAMAGCGAICGRRRA
jgi:hypothetical protein